MSKLENEFKRELGKIVGQIKKAQNQIQAVMKEGRFLDEAKKYAEAQGKEIQKMVKTDLTKAKAFLEKEKRQLKTFQGRLEGIQRKFQKNLPGEVKKVRGFLEDQFGEAERLVRRMKRFAQTGKMPSAPRSKKSTAARTAGKPVRKKTAKSASSATAASGTGSEA